MRLFIALLFSEELRRALLRAISDLRAQADAGVFTRPENLHLTLAFLGETDRAAAAAAALGAAAGPPFPLTLDSCGRFGDLWWAGVKENPALSALSRRLRQALDAQGLSYDRKPFHPHITLARGLSAPHPPTLSVPECTMTAARLSLMCSERVAGRLTYTEIEGCPLR